MRDKGIEFYRHENDDYNFTVYVINTSNRPDHETFLEDEYILIFDRNCNEIKRLENDKEFLFPANALIDINLKLGVLVVEYHVNPDASILRRLDLVNFDEKYFSVLCPPDDLDINDCVSTSYNPDSKGNNKFQNDEYGIKFDYPSKYSILEDWDVNWKGSVYDVVVLDYSIAVDGIQMFEQAVFTINVFEKIEDLPDYKQVEDLGTYVNRYYTPQEGVIDVESINSYSLSSGLEGYKVRNLKEIGVVALYTILYFEKNEKVYVINSNIPAITYKNYDTEFQEILNSLEIE